jgi:signal transduction histidine kinase
MNVIAHTNGYVYLSGQSFFDMKKTLENFVNVVGDMSSLFEDIIPESLISQGLKVPLQSLCDTIETNFKLETRFNCLGDECRLTEKQELMVYQIIQELVINVINHANAKKMTLELNKCNNRVFIKVIDDGKGMDNSLKNKKTDGGLNKIRAKLADKYGWLAISGQPGKGTTVTVEINFNSLNEQ